MFGGKTFWAERNIKCEVPNKPQTATRNLVERTEKTRRIPEMCKQARTQGTRSSGTSGGGNLNP